MGGALFPNVYPSLLSNPHSTQLCTLIPNSHLVLCHDRLYTERGGIKGRQVEASGGFCTPQSNLWKNTVDVRQTETKEISLHIICCLWHLCYERKKAVNNRRRKKGERLNRGSEVRVKRAWEKVEWRRVNNWKAAGWETKGFLRHHKRSAVGVDSDFPKGKVITTVL